MKKTISTNNAPAAIGPYSQAIEINNFIFISGQIPLDPKSMSIVGQTIEEQTKQVLVNLGQILSVSGIGYDNVVKTTCYLQSMDDFAAMNSVYASFFTKNEPARAAVEVSRLPKNVLIEIEAVAFK